MASKVSNSYKRNDLKKSYELDNVNVNGAERGARSATDSDGV
jgi:hypothetical protein